MVICSDCGKDVKDAKFCSNCGALLVKSAPVEDVVDETVETGVVEVPVEVGETVDGPGDMEDDEVDVEPPEEVIETNGAKKSKFCPNCGAEIAADTPFCPQCGFKLNQEEESQTKFCQSCGKKININAEICPYCGVRVSAPPVVHQEKSVALAAILSFLFPGLGHLYNGLTRKGVSFIIAYIVSAVLIFLLIGFVLIFIVWIWALFDAIKTTEAINNGESVDDKLF